MLSTSRGGAAGILLAAVILAGCATAYGPHGITGGYADTKLAEDLYRVSFSGNGKTSRDMVWHYWIYRCAELTQQQGYSHFIVLKSNDPIPHPVARPMSNTSLPQDPRDGSAPMGQLTPTATHSAPVYIYTPGVPIVTYSGNAVVKMLRVPADYPGQAVLSAEVILKLVGPYVKSAGQSPAPPDQEVIKAALVFTPVAAAPQQRSGQVTIDDLKNLLPSP
ncbi:CC0125/CC1285 family lipoprotein [Herbaspirillum sp. NPDC087042]|uniref:CC0125/CC1285 family lipoprotein n=1 Tax=Herbaspirillum sp. NPDC087042 TaxID=3364004 RepID=UPI003816C714